MLAYYDNRLDPLISIEQRTKAKDFGKRAVRYPSPFTIKNSAQSTALGSIVRTQTLGYIGVQDNPSISSIENNRGGTGYASNVSTTFGGARFT